MPTPSVAEETIAEAYELGRRQIRERSPLGGAEPAQFFAMPAAIVLASGGDWLDEAPVFKELPEADRHAMRIVYETIFNLNSPEVRYSSLMGEILDLRINFFGKIYRAPIACDPVDWTQNEQKNWKYLGKHLLIILKYARKKFATRRRKKAFVSASKATGVGDLAWLAESRDPDLWHLIAAHANPDLLEKFVGWVIQQPECDRATAAYLFLKLSGPSCFLNPPSGPISSWSFVHQAVARICNRSEKGDGFPRRELTLSEIGETDDQREVLLGIQARTGSGEPFAPAPVRLLGEVFEGRATDSPYDVVGEGDIVDAA